MPGTNLVAVVAVLAGGAVALGAGQTGGTLNYRDVTATNIQETIAEISNNEKEVEFGDFDNDGDLDVVIADAYSDFGTRRNKLYRNDDNVFNEISGGTVIPGFVSADVSRNAFFRDYDNDGWLDIIIVNDANTDGDGGRTKIYMNQHPGGVFSSFTEEGLARLGPDTGGAACGAVSIDADYDKDFDLYVGNYPGPAQDTLYLNDALGYFTNVTATNVPVDSEYTVDVSSADMNGDGRIDLLVTNGFGTDQTRIYYNDNQDAGSGLGDFSYADSGTALGTPSMEAAIEPGDFDNDGDQDFYWTNRIGPGDRVYRNDGNDTANKAVFTSLSNLPQSVTGLTSRKATVADLNGDGRVEVFVMKGDVARPTLLRNVTVNGNIQFVDWTPANAFPTGSVHLGWHTAAFDADGDDDLDLFLGGWADDHLFHKVPGAEYLETQLAGGTIPGVVNKQPASVLGSGGAADVDVYTINGTSVGELASVVVNGADDYLLELLDGSDTVLATIDRGGAGIEEAVQYGPLALPDTLKIRITIQQCGSPYNVSGDCGVGIVDFLDLLAAWGPNPGHPADFDGDGFVGIGDFLDLLAAWGASDYNLEVLIRSG